MAYKSMIVRFSNKEKEIFELRYDIRSTESAQLWADCVVRARQSGLKEKERFYNFRGHESNSIDNLLNSLKQIQAKLMSLHAGLFFPEVDRSRLQESVNELHHKFAHGHHVHKFITEKNNKYWDNFNVVLHAIETVLYNNLIVEQSGLSNSRVIFTWNDQCRVPIPEDCYKDFCINFQFGTAYINYPQVGRHFFEMFVSKDDQLADEHIQPTRFISADTLLTFGPTAGHSYTQRALNSMKVWFEERRSRFNSLGFFWGDPKLALGQIPVARLSEPCFSHEEINVLTLKLAQFPIVEDVYIS